MTMTTLKESLAILKQRFMEEEMIDADFQSDAYRQSLAEANTATYKITASNSMLLEPRTIAELQKILEIIRSKNEENEKFVKPDEEPIKHCINIVSTMKNYGYGCADPIVDQAILIRLKRLNVHSRGKGADEPEWIDDYGKELGLVRLGPGVTQKSLYAFLKRERAKYWMDATGAPTEAGILSNYIERGFGHTIHGDHFEQIMAMEVLLTDGTVVKTGHAGYETAKNIGVHKAGVGPVLHGLFTQSNFGIVVAIYIKLMPAVKYVTPFFIRLDSAEEFARAAVKLRELKMKGTLNSQMHCVNDHKAIQAMMPFPLQRNQNKTPLSNALLKQLAKENRVAEWTISGAIYADSWLERLDKILKTQLALWKIKSTSMFIPESVFRVAYRFIHSEFVKAKLPKLHNQLGDQLVVLKYLIGLKKGEPTNKFMQSVYWRKFGMDTRDYDKLDPRIDKVGMIWVSPIAPVTKENVLRLVDITYRGQEQFGFEPAISMTMLNEAAIECVVSIIYDKNVTEDCKKALRCHDELLAEYIKHGFIPYRYSSRAKAHLEQTVSYQSLIIKLQNSLDASKLFSRVGRRDELP